jgi:hypothetical protein
MGFGRNVSKASPIMTMPNAIKPARPGQREMVETGLCLPKCFSASRRCNLARVLDSSRSSQAVLKRSCNASLASTSRAARAKEGRYHKAAASAQSNEAAVNVSAQNEAVTQGTKRDMISIRQASTSPTNNPLPVQRNICCIHALLRHGCRASTRLLPSAIRCVVSAGRDGAIIAIVPLPFLYSQVSTSATGAFTDQTAAVSFAGAGDLSFLTSGRIQDWKRLVKFGLTKTILRRNRMSVMSKLINVKAIQGASGRPWREIIPVPPAPLVSVLLSAEMGFHALSHCIHTNQRGLP